MNSTSPLSPEAVAAFFVQQLEKWPTARANFDALKGVEVRELGCIGLLPVKVQFNPARRVSSAAKVDAASLAARKCFLCGANRPAEQIVHPWGNYEFLINPFPIFPRHFTIPRAAHTDQRIKGAVADMALLARQMGPEYTVFYNGPRCGASAPDHMHFQAGNTGFLTLPALLDSMSEFPAKDESGRIWTLKGLPMGIAVIDTHSPEETAGIFDALAKLLPDIHPGEEPMMNILCYVPTQAAAEGGIRLVVIPRKAHRPACYGTEGPDAMLISPASVDMGGVFITPREEDFKAITPEKINEIFAEVCYTPDEVEAFIDRM